MIQQWQYKRILTCILIAFSIIMLLSTMFWQGSLTTAAASSVAAEPLAATGNSCFAQIDGSNVTYSSTNASAVQEAADAAVADDLIKVAGQCTGVNTREGLTQTLYISIPLTVRGGYAISHTAGMTEVDWATYNPATYETTLDANNSGRVIYVAGVDLTLEDLTVTNGLIEGDGGGIYHTTGILTLLRVTLEENETSSSGGGGLKLSSDSGRLNIIDSTVRNNSAAGNGGGLNISQGDLAMTGTLVYNNSSEFLRGGGLSLSSSDPNSERTIYNSTISNNTSRGQGGAIYHLSGRLDISYSTIVSNSAGTSQYDGVYVGNDYTIILSQSLLSHADDDCNVGVTTDAGYNVTIDATCGLTATTSLTNTNPLVLPLDDNGGETQTHALQAASPAADFIPAGTNGCGTTVVEDQRGVSRPQVSACSSGAYEFDGNRTPVATNDRFDTDVSVTFTAPAPGVLENDSDPNNDTLTTFLVTTPLSGTLALTADGSFIYTPTVAITTTDQFTYQVSDGIYTDTAVVTINLAVGGPAPTAVNDSYSLTAGDVLTVAAPGVLANDTDPQNDPLTATLDTNPASGAVTLNTDGSFVYTSTQSLTAGTDQFIYIVSDGVYTDTATVTLNLGAPCVVRNPNSGQVFNDPTASALQEAIDAAAAGDTLQISGICAGIQTQNGLSQTVYISKSLTLAGGYTAADWANTADGTATLDAETSGRVIYITNTVNVTLTNLIIANGQTTEESGAGIYIGSGHVTLTDSHIQSNTIAYISGASSGYGAGLYISEAATLNMSTSTVSHNQSAYGGGGLALNGGTLTVTDSVISNNTTFDGGGGGIRAEVGATLTVTNSTFMSNDSEGDGGAIQSFDGAQVAIANNSIISNTSGDDGGGVYIASSSIAQIENNLVTGNTAYDYGGGLYVSSASTATIQSNTISHNDTETDDGGGVAIRSGSQATITNNLIQNNQTADRGGGLYVDDATATITENIVRDNLAEDIADASSTNDHGGGVAIDGTSTAELTANTLYNNTAHNTGGGLYIAESSAATLTNMTISQNEADTGGGIYIEPNGQLTMTHGTIVNNSHTSVTDTIGGLYVVSPTLVHIGQSIIANNAGSDCSGAFTDNDENLDSDGSCLLTAAGSLSTTDPLLASLSDNQNTIQAGAADSAETVQTHALQTGSPAIDTALNSITLVDQRGIARPQGNASDMGAFELSTVTLTITLDGSGSGTVTSLPSGIDCGTTCVASLNEGTVITLTATAEVGSVFAGWSGACSGMANCVVTLDAAKSVTALFTAESYPLTVNLLGSGSGSVTKSPDTATYTYGTAVTLTATADLGSQFIAWGGACTTETSATCTIVMTSAQTVTATFEPEPPEVSFVLFLPLVSR